MYGFSKPPGVPCPPNNPYCHGIDPVEMSIQSDILTFIIVIAIFIYAGYVFKVRLNKPKVKITLDEVNRLNDIYDEVNLK